MQVSFSRAMLRSINNHIQEARAQGAVLDVYRTAETIRLAHIADNVALEDIIGKIVMNAGGNLPVEFNMPEFAAAEVTEVTNGSPVELLVIEDETIH